MRTFNAVTASLALAAALGSAPAMAAIYDVSTGFDPASNPTAGGVWRYGYAATLGGAFVLYTNAVNTNGIDFWQAHLPPAAIEPLVLENQLGTTQTNAYRISILPPDQFALHPGSNGEVSVVRWTTPSSGTYAMTAIFTALGTASPLLANVHVLVNNASMFSGIVTGFLRVAAITTTRNFTAGDRIDFVVGAGGNSFSNDTIGLNVEISTLVDTSAPSVSVAAAPSVLWPPNGKPVQVTISGQVTDAGGSGVAVAEYDIEDEYAQVGGSGPVALNADGTFSFTVNLLARRKGSDKDGRHYRIIIGAQDGAGNHSESSATVIVPHDMRQQGGGNGHGHNGNGNGNGNNGNHGAKVLVPQS